ncbi:MAG: DUF4175 domain-containing protein [Anaerolineae bacterium]|nr:DUF4175 domain-containing protein [Anaerolineae bacterium]
MSRASFRLLWALRILALGVIALALAAPLFREDTAWGLWPATYLPPVWRWTLALLAAGVTLFGDRVPTGWLRRVRFGAPWTRLAIALLSVIPFYLFRIQHLRWGDAYILIHAIPHPQARLTYTWQAPLDLFLHAKAWALGNRLFGWPDPTPVYWLISAAAGVVFVWLLLGLAHWLGRDRTERFLLVGLVASLGLMQLFFGYIENYTLMTVGVLITIWLALRAQRGEIALVWPATALALTHAFHPSTIILAPSLLYLARQIRHTAGPEPQGFGLRAHTSYKRLLLQIAIPYLLVLIGIFAFMTAGGHGLAALLGSDAPGGGDRSWLVPLVQTSTRWEHYTMFSLGHLLDITNGQLLVAPVIWPGLLLAFAFAGPRVPRRDGAFRLLLLMSLLYLLLTLTWNPDYGGKRDWDLFAPAALPVAILFGYVLARALPERNALRGAGCALIAAQALHTVMWIYQNTLPWAPG